MRPARKARGGRIPGVFNRRATQRPGMQRRPNVTGLWGHDTSCRAGAAFALREPDPPKSHFCLSHYFENVADGALGVDPPGPVLTTTA